MPSSPRVVLLGDIGREAFYHLGDEAMSDAAIDALRQRGITDITLVATQPHVATEFYGLPAVARFGFWDADSTATIDRKLDAALSRLDSAPEPGTINAAIAEADIVIIAGGGNLNADHHGQFMERATAFQVARHHGVPLIVAGQTVGPQLREHQRGLLAEMLDYALCFAAREDATYRLLRDLGPRGNVLRTLDDAVLLDEEDAPDYGERYAIGSFVNPLFDSVDPDQVDEIAERLEVISARLDCDIVLIPHLGTFAGDRPVGDQLLHAAVVERSDSGRIRTADQLTARQLVHATRRSLFSLSTRYHPAVFAPAAGTPSFPVATSAYSRVRMRGALQNFGHEATFVPWPLWKRGDAAEVIADTLAPARAHLAQHAAETVAYQGSWWDAAVDAISSGTWNSPGDATPPPPLDVPDRWAAVREVADELAVMLWNEQGLLDEADRAAQRLTTLDEELAAERRTTAQLRADLERERHRADGLAEDLENVRSRKVVRAVDGAVGLVRRAVNRG